MAGRAMFKAKCDGFMRPPFFVVGHCGYVGSHPGAAKPDMHGADSSQHHIRAKTAVLLGRLRPSKRAKASSKPQEPVPFFKTETNGPALKGRGHVYCFTKPHLKWDW